MQFGFNLPNSGALAAPEIMCPHRARGRGARLRLSDRDRPCRAARHGRARLSLFRERRVLFARQRLSARDADARRLSGGDDVAAAARAGGAGRAASPGGAGREAAGDDRRAVRRPADGRDRRRLAQGRVRRGRHHALRRARRRHRRIPRRVPHAVDRRRSRRIDGKLCPLRRAVLEPKPVQKPHPPIWVGGESGPSLRRAARLGDAWYPIGTNNAHLLDSLPRYQAGVARLRQLTAAAGRERERGGADLPRQALRRRRAADRLRRRAPAVLRQRRRHHRRHPRACAISASPRSISISSGPGRRRDRRDAFLPGARAGTGLGAIKIVAFGAPASQTWRRDKSGAPADAIVLRRRRPPSADPQGLARRDPGAGARARPADHRPAPSFVGPAGQPLSVPRSDRGSGQRPQHPRHRVSRMPRDVPRRRARRSCARSARRNSSPASRR